MGGMLVTLPSGRTTYIGRRGRLPDGYGDTPPPPGAKPMSAVVKAALQSSPLSLPAPVPLRTLSTAGSGVLIKFPGFIVGWSIAETSGSAAFLAKLYDGADATGQLLAVAGGPQATSAPMVPQPPGWTVLAGLYLSVVSGAFDGVVWYLPVSNEGAADEAPPLTGIPAAAG